MGLSFGPAASIDQFVKNLLDGPPAVEDEELGFGASPGEAGTAPEWSAVYQGLLDRGLSPTVASAAAANIGAESGFDPAAFNEAGGGQGAFGSAQWRGDRQTALRKMAADMGVDPADLDVQLDFLVSELGGSEAATMAALEGVTDPAEAARIFRDKFERPGGHGYGATDRYANEISTYLGDEANAGVFAANERMMSGSVGGGPAGGPVPNALRSFSQDADGKADKLAQLSMNLAGEDLAMGTAVPGPSAEVTRSLPSGSPVVPAGQGAGTDAGPEGGGFLDNFLSSVFPNQENPREHAGELLGGLGVGLGQMSHGQPVDLQDYFGNIANQKQTIIDAKSAHQQQAMDNAFRDRSIAVQEGQLGIAGEKLARDAASAVQSMQPGGGVFTPEQIADIQANPQTRHLIPQLGSRDSKIYGQAIKEYNDIMADNLNQTDSSGSMSNLHSVASNPNSTPQELSAALEGMDNADVDTVFRMPGLKDNRTALVKNTDHLRKLAETDPEAAVAFEKVLRIQSGLGEFDEKTMDLGFEKASDYGSAASSAAKVSPTLAAFRKVSDQIITQGGDTSALGGILGTMQGIAAGMGVGDVDQFLAKYTGATADQLDQMTQAEKILAFELGRQWLEGQGSVSDGERQQLVQGMVSGNTTSAQRSRALSRLEVMGEADKIVYEEFMKNAGDKFENSVRSERRIITVAKPAIAAISNAATAGDLFTRAKGLYKDGKGDKGMKANVELQERANPSNAGTEDYDKAWEEIRLLRAPELSAEQAEMFSSLLKKRKIKYYLDPVTQSLVKVP